MYCSLFRARIGEGCCFIFCFRRNKLNSQHSIHPSKRSSTCCKIYLPMLMLIPTPKEWLTAGGRIWWRPQYRDGPHNTCRGEGSSPKVLGQQLPTFSILEDKITNWDKAPGCLEVWCLFIHSNYLVYTLSQYVIYFDVMMSCSL